MFRRLAQHEDAFSRIAEPVLQKVQVWAWILLFPVFGSYWARLIDSPFRRLATAVLVMMVVGSILFAFTSHSRLRIWVTSAVLYTSLVCSWFAFGPRFGNGVNALLLVIWLAVMLGAREGILGFALLLIGYLAAATSVVNGWAHQPMQPGFDSWKPWIDIGLPGFVTILVASRFLVLVGDLMTVAWERERASLREAAEGRALLKDARTALELAQRRALVSVLASGYAHDLNNLLTVLRVSVENIAEHPSLDKDESRDMLAAMDRAAELTKHLLAIGRGRVADGASGVTTVRPVAERLPRLLQSVVHRRVKFEVECADDVMVPIAESRLEQVLLNLMMNAADSMPEGGRVGVSVSATSRDVIIRVVDSGSGIAADVLSHVFEPYFTTKSSTQGSGLGLPMVKQIVEEAGGRVSIDSAVGAGTTVQITLPRVNG